MAVGRQLIHATITADSLHVNGCFYTVPVGLIMQTQDDQQRLQNFHMRKGPTGRCRRSLPNPSALGHTNEGAHTSPGAV